jgi:uncharacterized protein (TIGR03435 family)
MKLARIILIAFASCSTYAQTSNGQPAFDVASIRPAEPVGGRAPLSSSVRPTGNGLTIENMTLKRMTLLAYQVKQFQLSGGPSWFDSARFDIRARSENTAGWADLLLMLQSLLADRFHLVIRRESREVPIYVMVLARKDGKLGPNLIPSKEEGCPPREERAETATPGRRVFGCGPGSLGLTRIHQVGVRIEDVASYLSGPLGRTVIDKTGLTGIYDIALDWPPDDPRSASPFAPPGPGLAPEDTAPRLLDALKEQLGLKLESQKGPVEIFVIDRAEKPSEN